MLVYIKEWPNRTATVMTGNGQVIWTFSSASEARRACNEWHNLSNSEPVIMLSGDMPDDKDFSSAA
jgi:hypothetical protein